MAGTRRSASRLAVVLAVATAGGAAGAGSAAPELLAAARSRDGGQVRALLRQGADPDAADRSGWTALHEAAARGDDGIARLLLEAGATPDLRSRSGGTPLDVAEVAGQGATAALLRRHGARGSGKSIGDTVCVRPWAGEGYCGTVEARDPTSVRLRVTRIVGCAAGCSDNAVCAGHRGVGAGGIGAGAEVTVPLSCLTHTGLR